MSSDQPTHGPGPDPARYVFGPFAQGGTPGQPVPPPPGFAGPGGPTGPTGPRRSRKVPILIGAGVLALILVVLVVVRAFSSPDPAPVAPQDPGTDPSATQAPAAKASDAVAGFLQAVAGGDVAAASAYAATPVPDRALLTPAVLAASKKQAPLTAVDVPEVADASASSVPARYKIGSTAVTATYRVIKVGDAWKLRSIAAPVAVGSIRSSDVPMIVNGVKTSRSTLYLLPGAYTFTSGTPNFDYGKRSTLVVTDPADVPNVYALSPGVSSKGRSAAIAAAKKSWSSCLKSDGPKPGNCPNRWTNSSFTFKSGTVTWTRKGSDPFKKPTVISAGKHVGVRVKVDLGIRGTCSSGGRTGTCTGSLKGTAGADVTVKAGSTSVRW
jgi:hypothetical protein